MKTLPALALPPPLLLAAQADWSEGDFANLALTVLGLLFSLVAVGTMGYLLSWYGQSVSPRERRRRLWRRVLPAVLVLLPALLLAVVGVVLLWVE